MPRSVAVLGAACFSGCGTLESVVFGTDSSVVEFGNYCFQDCCSLRALTFPRITEKIGTCCFDGCTSLLTVQFERGSKVRELGLRAFGDCRSIQRFLAPEQMTTVLIPRWTDRHALSESVDFVNGSAIERIEAGRYQPTTAFVNLPGGHWENTVSGPVWTRARAGDISSVPEPVGPDVGSDD
ncbi:MAG: leucine-rich repeat domain-containing protein [Holosporaceae bacterium]|nr:leucine-rich repeat domain-containing protein [Holosporaceae bacterium]